jgi:CRISPR/Cas system-associated exonuclease Cas4 (RecB family)
MMTTLPSDFHFSQGSLQDYVDCRRRFELRYLQRLAWPAVETEPVLESERRVLAGQAFHRLTQQHLLGVPVERLSQMTSKTTSAGEELPRWWANYLSSAPRSLGLERLPDPAVQLEVETTLSATLSGYRLLAKYDAILRPADGSGVRFIIVDWKTSRNRPRRAWLAGRLQTRLYPCLLVAAGEYLNNKRPIDPARVEMIYWFAENPNDPERFTYSESQYNQDREYLTGLMAEIGRLGESEFTLTDQVERCEFCTYRSLCERGVRAGNFDQLADEPAENDQAVFTLDFDQIAEVEF